MGERTQINLVVDQSQKDEWEAYAEESEECNSLSHLIRLAVSREIYRDDERAGDSSAANVQLDGISERFDYLEEQIGDVRSTVQMLVEDREGRSIEDLAGEVYDILPRIEDEDEWWDRLLEGKIDVVETNEAATDEDIARWHEGTEEGEVDYVAERYLTVVGIAEQLDVSEYRAKKAVARVEDSFPRVETQTHEGDTYVYEVV